MKKQIHLNESELHKLIKESVKRVLRESKASRSKIYAHTYIYPFEYCDNDEEINCLEQNNISDEYMITFEAVHVYEPMVMYYPDGSGYPGYSGIEDFELSDDDGLFEDILKIKDTFPKLYQSIIDDVEKYNENNLEWEYPEDEGELDNYEYWKERDMFD